MVLSSPRHPDVHLAFNSRNPFAWVSGVRQALRRSGAPHDEIARFSADALAGRGSDATWRVVTSWVDAQLL